MIRTVRVFALCAAVIPAHTVLAQSARQRATMQSLAGKWRACTNAGEVPRVWCTNFEFKINGDTLSGTTFGDEGSGTFFLVQGRIQGDKISFRSGNGCTDPKMPQCLPVVYTATYHGEKEWTLNVDVTDTPREEIYSFTMTRVTG